MGRSLLFLLALASLANCSSSDPTPVSDRQLVLAIPAGRRAFPRGDTVTISAALVGAGGSTSVTSGVTWRSLTTAPATVSQRGLVTFGADGNAVIEGTLSGSTAKVTIPIRGRLHAGAVQARETWLAADGPHLVSREIEVGAADTAVLTIESGAQVLLRPRALIEFGQFAPGRLVIAPGAGRVEMAADSIGAGSWVGLYFQGGYRSELRNVDFLHCGGTPASGAAAQGCLVAGAGPTTGGPPCCSITLARLDL